MGTSRQARKPMDRDVPSQGAIHAHRQATPCETYKNEKLDCCLQQPKLIKIYTKFMAESDFAVLIYFDFSKDTTGKKKKKTKN